MISLIRGFQSKKKKPTKLSSHIQRIDWPEVGQCGSGVGMWVGGMSKVKLAAIK